MRPKLLVLLAAVSIVVPSLEGCACSGNVAFIDPFEVPAEDADSLHAYASHSRVPIRIRSIDFPHDIDELQPGILDAEAPRTTATIENIDTEDDDELRFELVTEGPGTLQLAAFVSGDEWYQRELTIVDVDAIELAVTAPETPGIALPAVDPAGVRVFDGGTAAFRTSLFASGDEVFGLEAVTATPADPAVSTRSAVGCAPTTCLAVRAATEVTLSAAVDRPVDIELRAGSAAVTLAVVPTSEEDITEVVLERGTEEADGTGELVAHVVATDEAVLGAPVTWSVDGTPLEAEGVAARGDVLQFETDEGVATDVVAQIGERTATTSVVGTAFSVSSITSACGANGMGTPLALLALFVARRARRREKDAACVAHAGSTDNRADLLMRAWRSSSRFPMPPA